MCKVADKSYRELCEALLGQEAYKVSELTAQKLYRLEDTDELKAYGLDKQKAEAFLCGVELGKRAFTDGGVVEKTERWGERKMPYAIQDYENGIYVLVTFRAGKKCVLKLNKAMEITEEVLRHMIIRKGVC